MGDDIVSVTNIPLPCAVEPTLEEEPLRWEDTGVRIVYVDMKSDFDAYASAKHTKSFKPMDNKGAPGHVSTGSKSGVA